MNSKVELPKKIGVQWPEKFNQFIDNDLPVVQYPGADIVKMYLISDTQIQSLQRMFSDSNGYHFVTSRMFLSFNETGQIVESHSQPFFDSLERIEIESWVQSDGSDYVASQYILYNYHIQ